MTKLKQYHQIKQSHKTNVLNDIGVLKGIQRAIHSKALYNEINNIIRHIKASNESIEDKRTVSILYYALYLKGVTKYNILTIDVIYNYLVQDDNLHSYINIDTLKHLQQNMFDYYKQLAL